MNSALYLQSSSIPVFMRVLSKLKTAVLISPHYVFYNCHILEVVKLEQLRV